MATEKRLIDGNDAVSFLENSLSIIKEMEINGNMKDSIKWYEEFIKFIKKRQTVDAVEVVRCKDCKYFRTDSCPTWYEDRMTYRDKWKLDNENDFCSYGERK